MQKELKHIPFLLLISLLVACIGNFVRQQDTPSSVDAAIASGMSATATTHPRV